MCPLRPVGVSSLSSRKVKVRVLVLEVLPCVETQVSHSCKVLVLQGRLLHWRRVWLYFCLVFVVQVESTVRQLTRGRGADIFETCTNKATTHTVSLVPRPPPLCSLVYTQYYTQKWKSGEKNKQTKTEKAWERFYMNNSGCEVDVPNYKYLPESDFFTDQAEYSRSCVNVWGLS